MEVPPDAFELRAGKQSSLEALRARAVHASAEPVQPIPSSVTAPPPAHALQLKNNIANHRVELSCHAFRTPGVS